MINNVGDIIVLLGLKVLSNDNSKRLACSRNAQVTFVEKPQFKIISFQI